MIGASNAGCRPFFGQCTLLGYCHLCDQKPIQPWKSALVFSSFCYICACAVYKDRAYQFGSSGDNFDPLCSNSHLFASQLQVLSALKRLLLLVCRDHLVSVHGLLKAPGSEFESQRKNLVPPMSWRGINMPRALAERLVASKGGHLTTLEIVLGAAGIAYALIAMCKSIA